MLLKVLFCAVLAVVLVSAHIHEHPDPQEPALFAQVWEDFKSEIDWYHVNKASDWANLRQAHVKQHGCVRMKLTVNSHINPKLAVGPIFGQPGKSFEAFARFSSGAGSGFIRKGVSTDRADYEHASDEGIDNRAVAFKVFGVNGGQSLAEGFDGSSTDWHFTTATCVFTKNGEDSAAFFHAVNRGGLGKFLLTHPKDALKITATGLSGKFARDLLNVKYSSTAPFAMGATNSVKFSLQPFSTNAKPAIPKTDKANKHRYLLAQALKEKPGQNGFNLYVQEYKSERDTPVEIGYNDWNTPMELVGSIVIESPSLNESPEAENFCRGVNFNPWNQAPDYQPIGGVQRLRRIIYNNIQQMRRQYQAETGHSVVSGSAVDVTLAQVQQAYPLPNERRSEMELDEAESSVDDAAETDSAPIIIAEQEPVQQQHHSSPVEVDVNVHVQA